MLKLIYNESILSKDGITATSAQHLCNIAKEMYVEIEKRHANLQFYDKTVQSLTSEPIVLSCGISKDALPVLESEVGILVELKSFIAYFKEAIKYKESLTIEYSSKPWHDNDVLTSPELPKKVTLEEYLLTLPIKERTRYYMLETKCAIIGSFVHPNGGLSVARRGLMDALNVPAEILPKNQDNLIYKYNATIDPSKLDELFFKLQQDHRRAQAEFNQLKHDYQTKLDDDYRKACQLHAIEYDEWTKKRYESKQKFNDELNQILSEIKKLKIVIPDSLLEIHKKLSSK